MTMMEECVNELQAADKRVHEANARANALQRENERLTKELLDLRQQQRQPTYAIRQGEGEAKITPSYRALVAELVKLGVSCTKVNQAIQSCAKVFRITLIGMSLFFD